MQLGFFTVSIPPSATCLQLFVGFTLQKKMNITSKEMALLIKLYKSRNCTQAEFCRQINISKNV